MPPTPTPSPSPSILDDPPAPQLESPEEYDTHGSGLIQSVGDQLGSWVPFLDGFGPLARIVIVFVAAVVVGVLTLFVAGIVHNRRSERRAVEAAERIRERDEERLREYKKNLSEDVITELSVREGVRRARDEALGAVISDFQFLNSMMDKVYDRDLVDKTRTVLMEKWSDKTRLEFCLRYATPLSVLLSPSRLSMLSDEADLPETPEVVYVGEKASGLYALMSTPTPVMHTEWCSMLKLMRVDLDAPDMTMRHAGPNTVVLELNDRERRYSGARVLVDDTPTPDKQPSK